MSIVFDCFWWWREEFAAQPSPYRDDSELHSTHAQLTVQDQEGPSTAGLGTSASVITETLWSLPIAGATNATPIYADEPFPDYDWAANVDFSQFNWTPAEDFNEFMR